jgi:hypothetical protein
LIISYICIFIYILVFNFFNFFLNRQLITKLSKDLDIPTNQIKLLFDGETIGPGETPEGLDIEDDDLIDIKVINIYIYIYIVLLNFI